LKLLLGLKTGLNTEAWWRTSSHFLPGLIFSILWCYPCSCLLPSLILPILYALHALIFSLVSSSPFFGIRFPCSRLLLGLIFSVLWRGWSKDSSFMWFFIWKRKFCFFFFLFNGSSCMIFVWGLRLWSKG